MTDAFLHIQDFAQNASVIDRNIAFGVHLDGQTFSISGTYIGTLNHFSSVVCQTPPSTDVERLWNCQLAE